jgi:hypothetical protein
MAVCLFVILSCCCVGSLEDYQRLSVVTILTLNFLDRLTIKAIKSLALFVRPTVLESGQAILLGCTLISNIRERPS